MTKLADQKFVFSRRLRSHSHPKVWIKRLTDQDLQDLPCRGEVKPREWVLWALDARIFTDEKGERLPVTETDFDQFFNGKTAELLIEEVYVRLVTPARDAQRRLSDTLKKLSSELNKGVALDIPPPAARIVGELEKIDPLPIPTVAITTDILEAVVQMSEEIKRGNRSSSRKWWIGFVALVVFTFFGIEFPDIWRWGTQVIEFLISPIHP